MDASTEIPSVPVLDTISFHHGNVAYKVFTHRKWHSLAVTPVQLLPVQGSDNDTPGSCSIHEDKSENPAPLLQSCHWMVTQQTPAVPLAWENKNNKKAHFFLP